MGSTGKNARIHGEDSKCIYIYTYTSCIIMYCIYEDRVQYSLNKSISKQANNGNIRKQLGK